MSISFSGPPQKASEAAAYRRARHLMQFGEEVQTRFRRLDQLPGVDIQVQPGQVTVDQPHPFPTRLHLEEETNFEQITGSWRKGHLQVNLLGAQKARLEIEETPEVRRYRLEPQQMQVEQDRKTGTLTFQEPPCEHPERVDWGVLETSLHFPQGQGEGWQYRSAQHFKARMDDSMARLRKLDNRKGDLNPSRGLVIASQPGQPAEALSWEPGHGPTLTYEKDSVESFFRKGQLAIYEQRQSQQCRQLVVESNGDWHWNTFLDTHPDQVDVSAFQQEKRLRFQTLQRLQQHLPTAATVLAAGGLGAWLGSQVASFSLPLAVALGSFAAAGVTAGLGPVLSEGSLGLSEGLYRFVGDSPEEQLRSARHASLRLTERLEKPDRVREFQGRPQAEEVRQFLLQGSPERLALVARSLGQKGEPALILVDRKGTLPLQTLPQGLRLPGGQILSYEEIEGMTGLG